MRVEPLREGAPLIGRHAAAFRAIAFFETRQQPIERAAALRFKPDNIGQGLGGHGCLLKKDSTCSAAGQGRHRADRIGLAAFAAMSQIAL